MQAGNPGEAGLVMIYVAPGFWGNTWKDSSMQSAVLLCRAADLEGTWLKCNHSVGTAGAGTGGDVCGSTAAWLQGSSQKQVE